jgi:nucleotide-binding universal stress UspA family protein
MFKRILVALGDEPEIASHVMAEALATAQAGPACLNLLHVLFPLKSGFPDPMYMTLDGAFTTVNTEAFSAYVSEWKILQRKNLERLNEMVNEARQLGIPAEAHQVIGEPNRKICEVAESWNADLIVMGRRGRQGMSEFLLGSVSSYVMHHAPCAVLTVQGPWVNPPSKRNQEEQKR